MKIADKIGAYKKDNNITILQTNRWNAILEKAFAKGDKLGLSKEFITKYTTRCIWSPSTTRTRS